MNKLKKMLAVMLTLAMVLTAIPVITNSTNVKGATFAITSPTDQKLVAAGYIDITWSAATGGTVNNYTVYINGQEMDTVTGTSYEYYTTKVQMHSVYVKANYKDGTNETSKAISFGVSKKGLGLAQDMGANISLSDMGVAWYYNWGENPSNGTQYQGIEYVPMVWKETNANNFKNRVQSAKNRGYKYILTFNEPDLAGQCNMSVDAVYNAWQGIDDMEGINVSSPVTALWPQASPNWFQSFMKKVDNDGDYYPDFISIHCYPDNYAGAGMADWFLANVVDWAWNEYGLPIWITEFSTTGGSVTATGGNGTKEFWEAVMPGLDSREYVERYAAFGFNAASNPNMGLWNYNTGQLTPGGEVYKTLGNPEGYEVIEADYKVTTENRNTLLDDTKVINNVTCEDYVNKSGVSASANSEIGNNGLASLAIDDDIDSRWESEHGVDPGILTIDLGTTRNIKEVDVVWENASASVYTIEVSNDGVNWTEVAAVTGSGGRCDKVTLKNQASGRYVRINGTSRSTDYGYSIFDVAVYGTTNTAIDETTTVAPPTTEAPPTTFAVKNETVANNLIKDSYWDTYLGTGWAGTNGTISVKNNIVNALFTTTGGGRDDTIWGGQANIENVPAIIGNEYTYSSSIIASKDMRIRVKITNGSDSSIIVQKVIDLKAGQVYNFTHTFVSGTEEIDIAYALGGGSEGPTTNVSLAIYNNNLVNNTSPVTTEAPTTTVVVVPSTTEPSGETTTVDPASMKKPRKVTIKKINKKKLSAKKVSLKIKKVVGATGYEVAVYKSKKNANKDSKAIVTADSAKIKIKVKSNKLKNKKKLFVKVRAYVTLKSGTKVCGKWSKVKKVKIKK